MKPKVLIETAPSAPKFVREAWAKVFSSIGWTVYLWYPDAEPINDVEVKFPKPDLFICNTYSVDNAIIKYIRRNEGAKIAMFGSNWGPLTDDIDRAKYPITIAREDEKKNVAAIADRVGLIFIHSSDEFIETCMGYWRKLGINVAGIMNAADLYLYQHSKDKVQEKYIADVSLVSGYWPYKAINLNQYIVRLCNQEWRNLNIKIYGNGWNLPQYLGRIDDGEDAKVFASTTISPTISEPHSVDFKNGYDITERTFKTPIAGSFTISDDVGLKTIFGNGIIPEYSNYGEFKDLIFYYLKNETERNELLKKQQEAILEKHTYFDRISKMLGLLNISNNCITNKNVLFGTIKF